MRLKRNRTLVILFAGELVLVAGFYLLGSHGVRAELKLREQCAQLTTELACLQSEIDQLSAEIARWDKYPFYREKAAREQLNMIRPNEIVYLLPDKKM